MGQFLTDCLWLQEQFARSLLPTVSQPETAPHRPEGALSEYRGEIMLMDERWKVVLNKAGEVYMLIDRIADPDEQSVYKSNLRLHQ